MPERFKHYYQKHDYDCGAGVVGVTLKNSGYSRINHVKLMGMLGTNEETGTPIPNIVRFYEHLPEFDPQIKKESTYESLQEELGKGRVCLVAYQNWEEPSDFGKNESGHYGLVVKAENDRIHIIDSGYEKGEYEYDRWDFENRWVEEEAGKRYEGWMISLKLTLPDFGRRKDTLTPRFALENYNEKTDFLMIHELDKEAFPGYFWDENDYREALSDSSSFVRVVKDQGKIAGYVYGAVFDIETVNGEKVFGGEIASIVVDPDLRGNNFGDILFLDGIRKLKEMGAPRIFIHTKIDNLPMQNLAQKYGFEISGTFKDFYGDGDSVYQMELKDKI